MTEGKPRWLNKTRPVDLTGHFVVCFGQEMFKMGVIGSPHQFVLVFSTEEKLLAHMNHPKTVEAVLQSSLARGMWGVLQTAQGYDINQIDNGGGFCQTVWDILGHEIMLDPTYKEGGGVRYTVVYRPSEEGKFSGKEPS